MIKEVFKFSSEKSKELCESVFLLAKDFNGLGRTEGKDNSGRSKIKCTQNRLELREDKLKRILEKNILLIKHHRLRMDDRDCEKTADWTISNLQEQLDAIVASV